MSQLLLLCRLERRGKGKKQAAPSGKQMTLDGLGSRSNSKDTQSTLNGVDESQDTLADVDMVGESFDESTLSASASVSRGVSQDEGESTLINGETQIEVSIDW